MPPFDGIKKEKKQTKPDAEKKIEEETNIKEKTPDVEIHIIYKPKLLFSSDLGRKEGGFKNPQR